MLGITLTLFLMVVVLSLYINICVGFFLPRGCLGTVCLSVILYFKCFFSNV